MLLSAKAARQRLRAVLNPRAMQAEMMDGLIAWSGAILDRLMLKAPEQFEDDLAETAVCMILPTLAINWRAMLNDNDP